MGGVSQSEVFHFGGCLSVMTRYRWWFPLDHICLSDLENRIHLQSVFN